MAAIDLTPWIAGEGEPLTATDREIAAALGDTSARGLKRVARARVAAGYPSRGRGRPPGERPAPAGASELVLSLSESLAAELSAVPRTEAVERIRAHLSARGTRALACGVGWRAVSRAGGAWARWEAEAQRRLLAERKPAPPSPADEASRKVGVGRWSAEDRAELDRRAGWTGLRTALYVAEVALSLQQFR